MSSVSPSDTRTNSIPYKAEKGTPPKDTQAAQSVTTSSTHDVAQATIRQAQSPAKQPEGSDRAHDPSQYASYSTCTREIHYPVGDSN